jgi:hypothetical protein
MLRLAVHLPLVVEFFDDPEASIAALGATDSQRAHRMLGRAVPRRILSAMQRVTSHQFR